MFRIIISIFLLCVTGTISAQESVSTIDSTAAVSELARPELAEWESMPLNIPTLTERGTMPQLGYPWTWYGGWMNYWKLHQGMNLSLGASVFSTFGSGNTWSGAGFGQNVSMMYAMPFKNSKWSFALGGYFTNTIWAHDSYRELGVSGILDYKFNDKWNAYLYGQKSIIQTNNIPWQIYDMGDMGDRIGLGVNYNITPAISIGLRFEEKFYNNSFNTGTQRDGGVRLNNNTDNEIPKTIDNSKGDF